ncbi:zinc finger C2HC domain-containing protein 1B [Erinaceus europaeus]|uniref:Zinc finger C2HC domain-containing protein 1B n=1 Tax=Erinaceus europaeus TaxID=9365 RepID=A0ABM3XD54_ERIEU|nr:zinc finger C2HC domain-containing protein 1B [Erinaceus europaeus]
MCPRHSSLSALLCCVVTELSGVQVRGENLSVSLLRTEAGEFVFTDLSPGSRTVSATLDGSQHLFPCEVCGRRFAADVLGRHGPICRKLFNKKRKPFNSLRQRLQGTDIPTVRKTPQSKPQPVRKSNWRQQHEEFIDAIRSAKRCSLAMKEGRPLPPPPPPSINPDYIQCPYCMRRFNETAAHRHINFCKDQSSRRVFDPAQTAAKLASRAQARAQMSPKKEPTLTSAVGNLLQNRVLEGTSTATNKSGLAADPASGPKLRQGFTKPSKRD